MKMIFAMLHSEDVDETVEELNKEKYWVTKLSTTGGFLKNKNVTLVIGTEDEQVPGALKILKECAGARQSVKYTMPSMSTGSLGPGANSMIPIDMQVGGCTVFVVDVDQYEYAARDSRHADSGGFNQLADVHRRRLTLKAGVGCDNDFFYLRFSTQALHQLF